MSEELSLREKVFNACDNMQVAGEKITRETVRSRTGGSDRDLSKYISEWKAEKEKTAITVAGSSQVSQQSEESDSISVDSVPSPVPVISEANITQATLNAVQIVKSLRLAEIDIAKYLQENPHLLPEDVKREIAEAEKAAITVPLSNKGYFDPKTIAQVAIARL
ncbi:DNA-binding protein [Iningainema tapete]|uniref:DNA-binding protein n=1 Tax=Iningainema tapete BLCC-T55 TaxID=2748662 RepID=A0A8J6XK05_9CYAN|nr:DNA-binding protein [Iningainema tapete]MBD2773981.1 DNA-binding protein [Iningainema tapete BLCC-T55]